MADKDLSVADQKALEELAETQVALEIAKKESKTPEEKTERERLIEEIEDLKKRLDETIGERNRYKKERDEANENLRTMQVDKSNEKDDFDEMFGGMRWL